MELILQMNAINKKKFGTIIFNKNTKELKKKAIIV